MRRRVAVLTLLVVALAGCSAPIPSDPLGTEGDVRWDADIGVTVEDGLNESERAAVVTRAMARIEYIRDLEFESQVPVSVISRQQYLANRSGDGGNVTFQRWNDQIWEGLFLVGEDRSYHEVQNSTLGSQVLGYYSPSREEIVIVSDSAQPTLSRGTLVHELVHALQDQRFDLDGSPDTQDEQLAHRSVTEGEANYVQQLYGQRCEREWSCVDVPGTGGGGGDGSVDEGVLLVLLQPYVTGPTFVHEIRTRAGWPGVDGLHQDFPDSTEQVLHPAEYPEEPPVSVEVADRSGDDWDRFDLDQVADTVGEASIYAMFQANGVLEASRYSFQAAASAGWGGDALVPYRNGDRYGYVWETVWDSRKDAREFAAAYRAVLDAHDGRELSEGVYEIPASDPFGDAFRVNRSGRTVRIVNGPTEDSLAAIHPR